MEDQKARSKARAYCERHGIKHKHIRFFDWTAIAAALKQARDYVPPAPCPDCGCVPCECVARGYR